MIKSVPDISQVNRLFHGYADVDLIEVKRNEAAFANHAFDLTDADGQQYVMRVLREQLPETVEKEAEMQNRLSAADINTPHYLKLSNGSYLGEEDGVHFTLSKRIDGSPATTLSIGLVQDFGATLARLHNCLDGVAVPASAMQWFDPKNAHADLGPYDGPYKEALVSLVGQEKELFSLGLPKRVIHGDLWLGNIFADGDRVTAVFDLETAEDTLRIIDLARTYLSMRLETDYPAQTLIDALFEGYDSMASEPLTEAERANFGIAVSYVAGVCASWHAIQGTDVTEKYLAVANLQVPH